MAVYEDGADHVGRGRPRSDVDGLQPHAIAHLDVDRLIVEPAVEHGDIAVAYVRRIAQGRRPEGAGTTPDGFDEPALSVLVTRGDRWLLAAARSVP